jgi:truncated hemoglobin YjbI
VSAAIAQGIVALDKIQRMAIEIGDMKTALSTQVEINKLRGATKDAKMVVNVVQSPAWAAMVECTLDALQTFPEARAAVVDAWQRTARALQQPEPTVLLGTAEAA